jgi:hypothetical protein
MTLAARWTASLALLAGASGAAWGAGVPPEVAARCPQAFRVYGAAADVERAVDILVLPEGFREQDLPLFRCAAAEIFARLARRPPFDTVAHLVNVYRIDLASEREGVPVPEVCPRDADHTYTPFSQSTSVPRFLEACAGRPLGEPLFADGTFCAGCEDRWKDLGFFHDPDVSSDCRVIWTHAKGLRHVWALTACVPDVDLVIVLANSETNAGSGTGDSHPPVSVVALSNLADLSGPEGASGQIEVAVNLIAHELGHALGLLDEYSGQTGEVPEYHSGRNVVRRGTDGTMEPVPWASSCVDPDGKHECMLFSPSPCDGRQPDSGVVPPVGLMEGAFYETCGYYRASPACVLYELTSESYCAGCTTYLKRLFSDLGMTGQDAPPPSDAKAESSR